MKLSELILTVGEENVRFQNLPNDAAAIVKTKHGTKITFWTDEIQPEELLRGEATKKVGIVVWLPRNRVEAVLTAGKAPSGDA